MTYCSFAKETALTHWWGVLHLQKVNLGLCQTDKATRDERNFSFLSARGKQQIRHWSSEGNGDLWGNRSQLELLTKQTRAASQLLFALHFHWVFFPGLAGNCGSPGTLCGSSVTLCLSPGCLLGFQGSGSNLSEPRVTLSFSLANSLSSW